VRAVQQRHCELSPSIMTMSSSPQVTLSSSIWKRRSPCSSASCPAEALRVSPLIMTMLSSPQVTLLRVQLASSSIWSLVVDDIETVDLGVELGSLYARLPGGCECGVEPVPAQGAAVSGRSRWGRW
jgi:hypothetical protein